MLAEPGKVRMKLIKLFTLLSVLSATVDAGAERISPGGDHESAVISKIQSADESPWQREASLPITYASEDYAELKGGSCIINIRRQADNSVYIELIAESLKFERLISRGQAIPADKYPLQVSEFRFEGADLEEIDINISYDGSLLKIIDIDRHESPAMITVYELLIDSNLSSPRVMRVRDFRGDDLSTAKPNGRQIVCDDRLS